MFKKGIKAPETMQRVMITSPNSDAHMNMNTFYSYVKEAYYINPFIYAGINLIAKTTSSIKINVYQNDKDNNSLIAEKHLFNKGLLENVNADNTFSEFIIQIIINLYLSGNAYIHKTTSGNGNILELYNLNPGNITILKGDGVNNKIAGYRYENNSTAVTFDAENILHIKFHDPLNDFYGVSPLMSISWTIQNTNDIHKFNTKLVQNSARPEGAFVVESKLTKDQFDRLQRMVNEKYTGILNAGKPLLLEGGIDFKAISINPTDLNLIGIIDHNAKEIALALGIPEILLGGEQKTFNNYREARQGFYTETILPLTKQLIASFNNFLLSAKDITEGLSLGYAAPDIFKPTKTELWDRGLRGLAGGAISVNEFRAMVGFDKIVGGDVLLTPASTFPEPINSISDDY